MIVYPKENGMFYFIVNPNSGCGSGLKVWNQTKKYLNSINAEYDVFFTAKQVDAMNKAAEVTKGRKDELYLIAVGGDGTINEVINGIDVSSNVIFGFIPSGSGNDLGRSLGFPANTQDVIRKLFSNGHVRTMDYGVVTNADGSLRRRFIVSCGVGFDASVCNALETSKTKELCNKMGIGKLSYTLIGFLEYLKSKPVSGYMLIDGDRRVEFRSIFFISMQNHPFEGGGYKFAPNAQWNDGMLDATAVCSKNKLKLIPILLNKKKGLSENGVVRFFPFREAQFHIEKKTAMHTDGELMGCQSDFTVRCVEGKIRILM